MYRLLLLTFLFFIIAPSVFCDDVEITSIDVQPDQINPNLVPNGSFESVGQDSMPIGWDWNTGGVDSTCKINNHAFEGRKCIEITCNSSDDSVYAELKTSKPISIEAGKPYTLSVWFKSDNPGFTRIGGGENWKHRFTLPATNGKWKRFSKTFTPSDKDKDFTIELVVKGRTKGFLIDAIKLEAGSDLSFDKPSEGLIEDVICPGNAEKQIATEGDFEVPFYSCFHEPVSGTLEVKLSTSKDSLMLNKTFCTGPARILVKGNSQGATDCPRVITLTFKKDSKQIASAEMGLTFYSATYAKKRLDVIEQELPSLKTKLEQLKAQGQDVSYPMVSNTVLENFIGYAREDASKDEVVRAIMQLDDLETIKRNLDRDLAEALTGKRIFPAVPRFSGDTRPIPQKSSFIAPTITPGKEGREVGPVFFNGYGHFGSAQRDIEKFHNYGINIIQMDVGVWNIFKEEGKTLPYGPGALAILDRAQKAGVAVCINLANHYFPDWMFSKYPELKKKREGFIQYCLHSPVGQEMVKQFVSSVITPIKDHPALHSISLSNEPTNAEEPCEYASRDWHTWLAKRHGDIANLNNHWNTTYASFDEVKLPNPFDENDKKDLSRWADFVRWNQEFFASWHKMVADAVHEIAPNLPVHSKVMTFCFTEPSGVRLGIDPYLMANLSDINGNDSSNNYMFGEGEYAQYWLTNMLNYDLQRSVKDAPIYNSECHMILDRETRRVPAEHIRAALWQEAIHGQSATTIWVWERTFDKKHDFYGSIMHRPACAREVGLVNYDLNRFSKEVTAIQQAPRQVLILHDTSSMVRDGIEYWLCAKRAYIALNLSGINVGFITERQLESGITPDAPMVIVPYAKYLSNAAFETLKRFKGHLVVIGSESLAFDENGKPRSERLSADLISYDINKTTQGDVTNSLRSALADGNISPNIDVVDSKGNPVWGVEWRQAEIDTGTVLNVCNYLNKAVSIKLQRDGRPIEAWDLLNCNRISKIITLKPLEIRLLKIENRQ